MLALMCGLSDWFGAKEIDYMGILLPNVGGECQTYDVECYPNYFEIGFRNARRPEYAQFRLYDGRNDCALFREFLNCQALCFGFNSFDYDDFLLNLVLGGVEN